MVRVLPLRECGDEEIAAVKSRIENHLRLTGSKKAERLLANWDQALDKFHKVLPTDYERVLLAIKQAEDQGLQGDDAIQAAFEANAKVGH
jgi:glutamate synthase (ferredoxin)